MTTADGPRTLVFRIPAGLPVPWRFRIEFEPNPDSGAEFGDVRVLCCFRPGMIKHSEFNLPYNNYN